MFEGGIIRLAEGASALEGASVSSFAANATKFGVQLASDILKSGVRLYKNYPTINRIIPEGEVVAELVSKGANPAFIEDFKPAINRDIAWNTKLGDEYLAKWDKLHEQTNSVKQKTQNASQKLAQNTATNLRLQEARDTLQQRLREVREYQALENEEAKTVYRQKNKNILNQEKEIAYYEKSNRLQEPLTEKYLQKAYEIEADELVNSYAKTYDELGKAADQEFAAKERELVAEHEARSDSKFVKFGAKAKVLGDVLGPDFLYGTNNLGTSLKRVLNAETRASANWSNKVRSAAYQRELYKSVQMQSRIIDRSFKETNAYIANLEHTGITSAFKLYYKRFKVAVRKIYENLRYYWQNWNKIVDEQMSQHVGATNNLARSILNPIFPSIVQEPSWIQMLRVARHPEKLFTEAFGASEKANLGALYEENLPNQRSLKFVSQYEFEGKPLTAEQLDVYRSNIKDFKGQKLKANINYEKLIKEQTKTLQEMMSKGSYEGLENLAELKKFAIETQNIQLSSIFEKIKKNGQLEQSVQEIVVNGQADMMKHLDIQMKRLESSNSSEVLRKVQEEAKSQIAEQKAEFKVVKFDLERRIAKYAEESKKFEAEFKAREDIFKSQQTKRELDFKLEENKHIINLQVAERQFVLKESSLQKALQQSENKFNAKQAKYKLEEQRLTEKFASEQKSFKEEASQNLSREIQRAKAESEAVLQRARDDILKLQVDIQKAGSEISYTRDQLQLEVQREQALQNEIKELRQKSSVEVDTAAREVQQHFASIKQEMNEQTALVHEQQQQHLQQTTSLHNESIKIQEDFQASIARIVDQRLGSQLESASKIQQLEHELTTAQKQQHDLLQAQTVATEFERNVKQMQSKSETTLAEMQADLTASTQRELDLSSKFQDLQKLLEERDARIQTLQQQLFSQEKPITQTVEAMQEIKEPAYKPYDYNLRELQNQLANKLEQIGFNQQIKGNHANAETFFNKRNQILQLQNPELTEISLKDALNELSQYQ